MTRVAPRRGTIVAEFPDDDGAGGDVAVLYRALAAMVVVGGAICAGQGSADDRLASQQRRRAQVAGAFAMVGGAAGYRHAGVMARILRARPAVTVAAGLAPLALAAGTGRERTPAHFLVATGVAMGSGAAGPAGARCYAGLAAGSWLLLSGRGLPPRDDAERIYTSVVMPLSFFGAAAYGTTIADVIGSGRSVQEAYRRFEEQVQELDAWWDEIERGTAGYLAALKTWEKALRGRGGDRAPRLASIAAQRSRDRLGDVRLTVAAARAARRQPLEQLVRQQIAAFLLEPESRGIGIDVTVTPALGTVTPGAQIALLLMLQRALANARASPGVRRCRVTVARSADDLWVVVSDDGPGDPAQHVRLGKGSRHTRALLRNLGGDLALRAELTGFVAEARLPVASLRPSPAAVRAVDTMIADVERGSWEAVRVTAVMALAMIWLTDALRGPHRRNGQLAQTLAIMLAEWLNHGSRSSPRRYEAMLAGIVVATAVSRHGEFSPPSGWAGTVLGTYALRAPAPRVAAIAASLASVTAATYRGPRSGLPEMAVREALGTVAGGLGALVARRAFGRVETRYEQLDRLLLELEQLQATAEDVAYFSHGFFEPMANALGLTREPRTADEVQRAAAALQDASERLAGRLGDPGRIVEDVATAVAVRVWPVPVHFDDHFSVSVGGTGSIDAAAAGAARRRLIWAVAAATDELARTVRPAALGWSALRAVDLRVSSADLQHIEVVLDPVPRRPSRRGGRNLRAVLADLGATLQAAPGDGRVAFTMAIAPEGRP